MHFNAMYCIYAIQQVNALTDRINTHKIVYLRNNISQVRENTCVFIYILQQL